MSDILPEGFGPDLFIEGRRSFQESVVSRSREEFAIDDGINEQELSLTRKVMAKGNTLVIELNKSVSNEVCKSKKINHQLKDGARDSSNCDLVEVIQDKDAGEIYKNSKCDIPLSLIEGPLAKLWGGKSTPLLQPVHAKNTAKILSKLDLQLDKYNFMSTCKSDVQNVEDEMDGFPFRIEFDVYLPKVPFRKSSPHLPNYRVAVCKSSDPLPTHSDVTNLTGCYGDAVPLLFAICTISSVSFYCFSKVQLPKIISKG